VLNPAPAVRTLDPDKVRLATFVTPNETELAILTGLPVESEEEIEAATKRLLDAGNETVIVTLGARAKIVRDRGGVRGAQPVGRAPQGRPPERPSLDGLSSAPAASATPTYRPHADRIARRAAPEPAITTIIRNTPRTTDCQ
jgi:hypothetical protein